MSTAALLSADFKTRPYDHQIKEFELYADDPARAMAWTMRTGKSKVIIDRACHLYKAGKIDGLLIFAPNGVHANWVERELPAHCWDGVPTVPLIWRSSQVGIKDSDWTNWGLTEVEWWNRLKGIKKSNALFVLSVNSESMIRDDARKAIKRFCKYRRVFVIFDESDDFGAPGSIRTKMARALVRRCPFRAILSGTMVTGNLLAAFSQFELLERGALGFQQYENFEAHFADYQLQKTKGGRRYPKFVGYKNEAQLRERMARFTSVVLREDCKDMPDLVEEPPRIIKPSPEQLRIYRELHRAFIVDIEKERVSIGARAPRFQKLQQVFSGFVIDENGKVKKIPGVNPRLEALSEEVYLAPGKVIIWCQFKADMKFVRERLLADGHKIVEYHGSVSDKAKSQALISFRENRDVKALVGHMQAGGRGQDMSAACKIIGYSHTFKARLRQQALERATKIGGKNIHYVDFKAPGPDGYILETVTKRIDVADDIAGRGMREFLERIAL